MVITVGDSEAWLVAAWLARSRPASRPPLWLPRITRWLARCVRRAPRAASPRPFTGRVFVIDGDTAPRPQDARVRLLGIDAPELTQRGGWKARSHMIGLAGGREVAVEPVDVDCYGRIVARVWLGPTDLSERMVRDGFARGLDDWCADYAAAEFDARRQQARPLGDRGHRRSGRAPPREGARSSGRSAACADQCRRESKRVREERRGADVGGRERLVARIGRRSS